MHQVTRWPSNFAKLKFCKTKLKFFSGEIYKKKNYRGQLIFHLRVKNQLATVIAKIMFKKCRHFRKLIATLAKIQTARETM